MAESLDRSKEILEFFFKSSQIMMKRNPNTDLNHREIKILHMLRGLEDGSGVKVSVLSDEMKLTKPATSKILNHMEQKGYLYRRTDTNDRRVVFVSITPRGRLILEKGWEKLNFHMNSIISYMGEEKADEFIALSKIYFEAMCHEMEISKEDAVC